MAYNVKPASIFGRIGTGLGRGLAEQLPKEVERNRLASGLERLGEQKGLTPFQNFAGLVGAAHEYPQVVQSGGDLLRQQSIIDSIKNPEARVDRLENTRIPDQQRGPIEESPVGRKEDRPPVSATTTDTTGANLEPYIPPGGAQQEQNALQRMKNNPYLYPTIESARQAEQAEVAGNIQESNSRIEKGELEEKIQGRSDEKVTKAIAPFTSNLPDKLVTSIKQDALNDVITKKLTPDQAAVQSKKRAENLSKKFADIQSLGGMGLFAKNTDEVITSLKDVSRDAKENGYRREAADEMIASGVAGPEMSYAQMIPVKETKKLNDILKSLPNVSLRMEKVPGVPGIGGMFRPGGLSRSDVTKKTKEIAPALASAMGQEGSPLAISYELGRLGYDSNAWIDWISENKETYDLTDGQKSELSKTPPGFFGQMNDFFFRAFTGVE